MNWMIKLLFLLSIIYGNTFYFLQFQLNIHRFKCIARFGLAHIVATNLCVWIRTVVKECTKEIALYRVNRGHGVSEDYMILGMYKYLVRASSVLFCPKLLNLILYWSRNKIAIKKKINDNQDWIVCLLSILSTYNMILCFQKSSFVVVHFYFQYEVIQWQLSKTTKYIYLILTYQQIYLYSD